MIIDQLLTKKSAVNTDQAQEDKVTRSIVKSVSWRVIGTIDTIGISYFVTGTLEFALSIGFVELVTKMFLYTVHERLWNKINWGKKS